VIHVVFGLRRRADLSHSEFMAYWTAHHAPLVASLADVLGIRKYVQVHVDHSDVEEALRVSRGLETEPLDGIAELWFDDVEALRVTSLSARQAGRTLIEDERRFIDLPLCTLTIGTVHDVVG
jgi:hypothetical protein